MKLKMATDINNGQVISIFIQVSILGDDAYPPGNTEWPAPGHTTTSPPELMRTHIHSSVSLLSVVYYPKSPIIVYFFISQL